MSISQPFNQIPQNFQNPIGPNNSGYIPGPNIINPPNPVEQLNPYNLNIPPNLNYSVPGGIRGSNMPFLSGSINPNVNPYANNIPNQNLGASIGPNMGMIGSNLNQSINPFDPNTNYLQQNIKYLVYQVLLRYYLHH